MGRSRDLGWVGALDPRGLRTTGQRLAAAVVVLGLVTALGSWVLGHVANDRRYDALDLCDQPSPTADDCLSAVPGELDRRRTRSGDGYRTRIHFVPADDGFGSAYTGKKRGPDGVVAGLYLAGDYVGLLRSDDRRTYRSSFADIPLRYLVAGVLGLVCFGAGLPLLGWQLRRHPRGESAQPG